jgi:tetratricopeptide (TPR) repeat protein
MIDPYSNCPCGSGKQFKWCCTSIYSKVDLANQQLASGQMEPAVRTITQLTESYPKMPQSWVYLAQIYMQQGKSSEADEALQKALEIDPNWSAALFIRGVIRETEGELVGALILFRKAAEVANPNAKDMLSRAYFAIANLELTFNRPVAARAALDLAIAAAPGVQEIRNAMESLFGLDSRLPKAARKQYTFRRPKSIGGEASWVKISQTIEPGKLTSAATQLEKFAETNAEDPASWFNLGLVRAWLGDAQKAADCLDRSLTLEKDEKLGIETTMLLEVQRSAQGMQDRSDYLVQTLAFSVQDPTPIIPFLREMNEKSRLVAIQQDEESRTLGGMILDDQPNMNLVGLNIGSPVAGMIGYFRLQGYLMTISGVVAEKVRSFATEAKLRLAGALMERSDTSMLASFGDITMEAMAFPHRDAPISEIVSKMSDFAKSYFEDRWITRSLRSLNGLSPVDAASMPSYRIRLLGLIDYMKDCYHGSIPRFEDPAANVEASFYSFEDLKQKLGLDTSAVAEESSGSLEISRMSVAELAGLDRASLTETQLLQGFQAAIKLDATELAGAYAEGLAIRAWSAEVSDRYPVLNHLITLSQNEEQWDKAIKWTEQAIQEDIDHNSASRRDTLEVRHAQLLSKKGKVEEAITKFKGLLARTSEPKHFGTATEVMLRHNRIPEAIQFAEQGLSAANKSGNRDAANYFNELLRDARKRAGS